MQVYARRLSSILEILKEKSITMNLAELFDQLTVFDMTEFVRLRKEEHLQLDFKTVNDSSIDKDGRKNLAKYISGFANSAGGIIVWGIDARRDSHGIDCAIDAPQINQLGQFVARLNELSGQSTSPVVDGVRHKAIETSSDQGYAVTLIPESGSGPHMAKLGEDRYYKRNGQQFLKMEHFDLEDMFGRRQKPDLKINISKSRDINPPFHEQMNILVINSGRALARHVGFFAVVEGARIIRVEHIQDFSHLNNGRQTVSYANDQSVFHPSGIPTQVGSVIFERTSVDETVTINMTYYCEHMMPQRNSILMPPETP